MPPIKKTKLLPFGDAEDPTTKPNVFFDPAESRRVIAFPDDSAGYPGVTHKIVDMSWYRGEKLEVIEAVDANNVATTTDITVMIDNSKSYTFSKETGVITDCGGSQVCQKHAACTAPSSPVVFEHGILMKDGPLYTAQPRPPLPCTPTYTPPHCAPTYTPPPCTRYPVQDSPDARIQNLVKAIVHLCV